MKRPPPRRWSRRAKTSSNLMLTLTDDEFDEQHSECRSADCTQCTYKANRAKWHAAACFSAEPRVTWLAHKRSGCGCVACHEKYHGTAAATALADYRGQTLKWSNILRHKTTYLHRQAEAALARQTTPKAYAAPTPAEFKQTWQDVRAGNAAAKLLEGKRVNERKRRAMEWCLAEAVRDLHREFLADASTMSLSWDGRHGRLVSRFSATHENTLEVRQGTLGLERDYGSGNVAMARAMEVMVERLSGSAVLAATKTRKASSRATQPASTPTRTVWQCATRGGPAISSRRSSATSRRSRTCSSLTRRRTATWPTKTSRKKGFLPNVLARLYDQAHGGRRLATRPWKADEVTHEVFETLIAGKHSLTTTLQNSPELQKWLQSNLARCDTAVTTAQGLATGIRKHRCPGRADIINM